jgi:hypothetical protein
MDKYSLRRPYPNVVQEDEFPATKMGANCNIHIFDSCPVHPSTATLKCSNSPDAGCSVKSKEVQKVPIHLLFNLKVKAEIDIL